MSVGAASLDPTSVSGADGTEWCRAWTDAVDAAVIAAAAGTGADGVAVVALGGYARRELCPSSDVDLLLLHDGRADLEQVVRAICYPLWDAGLSVGHAVHTPKDAVRVARQRTDSMTALLERRLVTGARGRLDDLAARTTGDVRKRISGALRELAEADRSRRSNSGARPGLLEPDLKSGAGGLRDLHSLRWAAAILLGGIGLDPLVTAGYLSTAERAELAHAGRTLLAARCALHHVLGPRPGGHPDVLRLDLQDEVAGRLGLGDGDVLLREVNLAGRSIARLHGRVWPSVLADARGGRRRMKATAQPLGGGVIALDGAISVDVDPDLDLDPGLAMRAIAAAARAGTRLDRAGSERLRAAIAAAAPLPWDHDIRANLDAVLAAGEDGLDALDDAEGIGLLAAHLPEWHRICGRPQRNPFHRFDLDTHLAHTTAWLARVARGELDPGHVEVAERLPRPEVVRAGAWLHDVGKAWSGDHSVVGADIAADWVRHMGFDADAARFVALMVRHHLHLPDVATRRDIDDPDELAAIARTIGSPELLDALYLLSLADGRATGPSAWSAWKESLLARLHARVHRLLTDSAAKPESMFGPGAVLAEAGRRLGGRTDADTDAVAAALSTLPEEHLWAADADQALAHARLLARTPDGGIATAWRPGPAEGTSVLSLIAPDRTGLFADVAGVLAANGLVVLDARAATSAEGVALDWFTVAGEVVVGFAAADLAVAAEGGADVSAAVARRERRRDARPVDLPHSPGVRVIVDLGPDGAGRVEVHAPDWPGLLHRVAGALASSGCDIAGARVTTLSPEIRDTFFLKASSGPAAAIEDALRAAAEPPDLAVP